MNKTAIKNFAIWARVQLIEAAKQRAYEYDITENGENNPYAEAIGGRLLSKDEIDQRRQLIDQIRQKGYNQVMEEAAYTWFNRFIALRFMEVNGYLPSKVRVFTDENGAFKPEILKQAMSVELAGLDRTKVLELLDKQNNEELYKCLLITQCNALNVGLPYMFEKIANWTELLFPANLLRSDSVLGQMISLIPEEDWTDAVQIIGWLYQYYNSELKDETFALLKKNVKITKERIPAATQLFIPDWIVRYMVENSLGRLWYEGHKDFDKSQWKYYLDEAEQEPEVEKQLQKIREEYARIRPEEIKVIDPCMGSGHILVYAFDVLMQIYTSAGWSERDAARSIVENNLYGLDIDDRAGQLAYFAVMMKARKYSRRILNGEVKPNVLSIRDSNWMTDDFIAYVANRDDSMQADLIMLRKTFKDAKEYGSILNIPVINYNALYERIDILNRSYTGDVVLEKHREYTAEQLLPLTKQAQIMAQKYDVVVTNPPYMGSSGMSAKLGEFVKNNYPDSKSDLFAVFIEKCGSMTKQNRYQAMITQHAWMFLSSFEKLRSKLLDKETINMAHLGARAFEEIGGEVVQTTSFVFQNAYLHGYKGTYCRLIEPTTQNGKEDMFLSGENHYIATQDNFSKIPGSPVAYWAPYSVIEVFASNPTIDDVFETRNGMSTTNNNRFLRLWFECNSLMCGFGEYSSETAKKSGLKWFRYNKGGEFRKWFGNNDYLVNWENDGEELKAYVSERYGSYSKELRSEDQYFDESITWSGVTSSQTGFRYSPIGAIFDSGANGLFADDQLKIKYLLGFLNSKLVVDLISYINPTINTGSGTVGSLPIIVKESSVVYINEYVNGCVLKSKENWDSFETSWDFKKHPLV